MWDDFWNWLPSPAYEYRHNSLSWPDLPLSLSIFPGYPQGIPLMISAASFVGGRFLEAAGPIINALLLAGSSALYCYLHSVKSRASPLSSANHREKPGNSQKALIASLKAARGEGIFCYFGKPFC
jgi:hypothetical protein